MSTRCNIWIYGKNDGINEGVQLYHHCDGYPEGVGYDLEQFAENYKGERTKEAFAKTLNEADKTYELEKGTEIHTDIEFAYFVVISRYDIRLTCMSVVMDFETPEDILNGKANRKEFDKIIERAFPATLESFTDEDIIAELRRRCYVGEITKTISVTL